MSLKSLPDVTEREPERFERAVAAADDEVMPDWPVTIREMVRAAILAWEAPQHLGD